VPHSAPHRPEYDSGGSLRVLVIRASPLAARAAEMLAGADRMEAGEAADCAHAAELLAGGGWDVLLADAAADAIAPVREGWAGPLVLLAGARNGDVDAAARALGAADVLEAAELSPALLRRALGYAAERERRTADAAAAQHSLQTLLSILPGMAYRCRNDPQWTLEAVSPGALELTGIAPETLIGTPTFGELIHPDDRAGLWDAVQHAVRRGESYQLEYRLVRPNGEVRWVSEHGRAVGAAPDGGEVLEGYILDVTRHKEAEQALRTGEAQFRVVFEQAPIGMALMNMEGFLVRTNRALGEMLGYADGTLADTIFSQVTHGDDIAVDWERFGDLVAGDINHYQITKRFLHRDGSVVWGRLSVALVRAADGAPHYAIMMVENVTERREAVEALRMRERQFRSLVEYGRDVISVLDAGGDLRYTSPAVERVLGYGREELEGTYLGELVHPDDVPGMLELFDRAIQSPGRPRIAELRMRHRDGSWRTLETVGTSLLDDPAVGGIVVNSRDVTDRREAEEALRRSEQQLVQVQKMEAIGRLAGGVAHDFNNLLTAIRGNAELLLADLPHDSQAREDVEEIRRASDRAAALTRQLLAFSRRQVLQPRLLDLNQSVREMERMLGRLIGDDVELVTRLDASLRRVRADPAQVEQVIMNLAVNARDAMTSGGVLMVCTENQELESELTEKYPYVVPGEYVLLEVGDTGEGMDAQTVAAAFEPFFTTKSAGKGTGLGLSMVYGIVKQSGGYIWIESDPGRGTRVRVYLPVARGGDPEEEDEAPAPLPQSRGRGTVLLVEDEESVRRFTERVLARGGYTVLAAAEGAEAMALSRQHPGIIHALVTDLMMPRMNGSDLARRLMAERPGIRVLFISGYDRDAARTQGPLELGTDFIEKPFSPEALLDRIRRLLEAPRGVIGAGG
jgi:two-component system cell cycle sensor histidine kinase/response regulator CckA